MGLIRLVEAVRQDDIVVVDVGNPSNVHKAAGRSAGGRDAVKVGRR